MISITHLLNDMMQSVIPAVYPLLKEKFEEDMKQMYAMYIGGDNYAGE